MPLSPEGLRAAEDGTCGPWPSLSNLEAKKPESSDSPGGGQGGISAQTARSGLQRLQALVGLLLFLSAGVGVFLLATDRSLWLLAVSHAVGLIMIVAIDLFFGFLSLVAWKRAYIPSIAAAALALVLQLGDIFTAPQYGLTVAYFADYLFGLWAFDLLLALQVAIMLVAVVGRPYAVALARRKSRRGRELNLTRRSFLTSLLGLASAIGIGVLVSSIKLPTGTSSTSQSTTTTTQTGGAVGSIANANTLRVGVPLQFEYPPGYPNVLIKKSDGTLTALSLLCTHVCCVCSFDEASNEIYCPCHGSVFDAKGDVIQGPANSSLPKVLLRVDGSGNIFPTGISNPGPCHV
jgi:cytochrome b6-f complex iron-sulfur subunit